MHTKTGKTISSWVLVILAGIVLGSFIGQYLGEIELLSWLKYGQKFGNIEPAFIDLGIIKMNFGLLFDLNISGVLGIVAAVLLYKRA